MASKYQKRHYEDVAKLVQSTNGCSIRYTAERFADLFATDNPGACSLPDGHYGDCNSTRASGLDRERFLKACGLED